MWKTTEGFTTNCTPGVAYLSPIGASDYHKLDQGHRRSTVAFLLLNRMATDPELHASKNQNIMRTFCTAVRMTLMATETNYMLGEKRAARGKGLLRRIESQRKGVA